MEDFLIEGHILKRKINMGRNSIYLIKISLYQPPCNLVVVRSEQTTSIEHEIIDLQIFVDKLDMRVLR